MSIKLQDAPNGCKVRILNDGVTVPPAADSISAGEVLFFWHIDGMYGRCTNEDGVTVYPVAWTLVRVLP